MTTTTSPTQRLSNQLSEREDNINGNTDPGRTSDTQHWINQIPSELVTSKNRIDLVRESLKFDEQRISEILMGRRGSSLQRISSNRVTSDIFHIEIKPKQFEEQGQKILYKYNPEDPNDDLKVFWTPNELIQATMVMSRYNVKQLYEMKNPNTVKRILNLVLLIEKYKPLLKDFLHVGEYFEYYPEDEKDEAIVLLALFDILCRRDGNSLENELLMSDREDYKDSGLKVVYMQVEKDKMQYFDQMHERLIDVGASSLHELLPLKVPIRLNLEYPKVLDIWINKNKMNTWSEDVDLLKEAGFKEDGKNRMGTYQEITMLPYFYQLKIFEFSNFVQSSHYVNKIFIPADRNHCLAISELVKRLLELNIVKGTVIQTHILSLGATAYFACLLSSVFSPPMKLIVYGADKMKESFERYFSLLGLKNITVIHERFYVVNPRHKDIARTTSVLVNPETTFDPNVNIIDETINRGCDIIYMQSICETFRENDVYSSPFLYQHEHDLKEFAKWNMQRALTIPKVKFVVYQSFDRNETPKDNIGLYVVNYETECSHTSVVSVTSGMSASEIEDANYKYCRKLDLYFRQGNTPEHTVSPELWGLDPPFVTIFYRIEPIITETETEEERKSKTVAIRNVNQKKITVTGISRRSGEQKKTITKIIPTPITISPPKYGKSVKESDAFRSLDEFESGKMFQGRSRISVINRFSRRTPALSASDSGKNDETVFWIEEKPPDIKQMVSLKKMPKNNIKHSDSSAYTETESETAEKYSLEKKRKLSNKETSDENEIQFRAQQESMYLRKILGVNKDSNKREKRSIKSTSLGRSKTTVKKKKHQKEGKHSIPSTSLETDEKMTSKQKKPKIVSEEEITESQLVKKLVTQTQKEPAHLKPVVLKKNAKNVTEDFQTFASKEKEEKPVKKQNYNRKLPKKKLTVKKEQTILLAQKKSVDLRKIVDMKNEETIEQNFSLPSIPVENKNTLKKCNKLPLKNKKVLLKKEVDVKKQVLHKIHQEIAFLKQNANLKNKNQQKHPVLSKTTEARRKNIKVKKDKQVEDKFVNKEQSNLRSQLDPLDLKKMRESQTMSQYDLKEPTSSTSIETEKKVIKKDFSKKKKRLAKKKLVLHKKASDIDIFVAETAQADTTVHPIHNEENDDNQIEKNVTDSILNQTDLKESALDDDLIDTDIAMGEADYKDILLNPNIASIDSIKQFRNRVLSEDQLSVHTVSEVSLKGEEKSETNKDEEAKLIRKMVSWFRKLEAVEPKHPRFSSFKTRKKFHKVTSFGETIPEPKGELKVEEEITAESDQEEIPPLLRDYEIQDAQAIATRLKMFEAGERDLDKLISLDAADTYALDKTRLEGAIDEEKEKDTLFDKEHIDFFHKYLKKTKTEEYDSIESGELHMKKVEEQFDPAFEVKFNKLIDSLFEPDGEKAEVENESSEEAVPEKSEKTVDKIPANATELQERISAMLKQGLPVIEIEQWLAKVIENWKIEGERKKEEEAKRKMEEELEDMKKERKKISSLLPKSEKRFYDIVPEHQRTSTKGLSPLAKELYEIRDIVEYYFNSNEEPLDWRVLIDRRVED